MEYLKTKAEKQKYAVVRRCSEKKDVLRNFSKFTWKHQCKRFSFNNVAGLRTPTLLQKSLLHCSCEFCEISKNTFFYRTPPVDASGKNMMYCFFLVFTGMCSNISSIACKLSLHFLMLLLAFVLIYFLIYVFKDQNEKLFRLINNNLAQTWFD